MKIYKVYVSGAITGTKHYMKRFAKAEKRLRKGGFAVLNPAKVNSGMPKTTKWHEYMKISLSMLSMADCMVILPNYEESRGVAEEIKYAEAHNIPIFHYTKNINKIITCYIAEIILNKALEGKYNEALS